MSDTNTLEEPVAEDLANDIVETRSQATKQKIRVQVKRPYMYLSDVHQCTRHNFYSMVDGDKRRPFTPWVQELVESGNVWERETVRELMGLGYDVIAGQQPIEIKYKGVVIGKGKIDGKIKFKKKAIPFEIKSLGENIFRGINSVDDFFKYEFTEKYIRQLLMYLWGEGIESGIFIINDRGNHWKVETVHLGNYLDYCEKVLRNMERAWDAKLAGKEPDRISYNHRICGNCQFNAICCPEMVIEGGVTLNDPELEEKIRRHESLKPLAKEYKDSHEDLAALFKKKAPTTIGNFIVTPKKTVTKGSIKLKELPTEVLKSLEQYRGKPTDSWQIKVDDITKKPEDDAK